MELGLNVNGVEQHKCMSQVWLSDALSSVELVDEIGSGNKETHFWPGIEAGRLPAMRLQDFQPFLRVPVTSWGPSIVSEKNLLYR